MNIIEALAITAPTIFSGMVLWFVKRLFDRKEADANKRDKERKEFEYLTLQGVSASLALGEATAEAIQTGKCNGNLSKACEYATQTKHDIKNFMFQKGVEKIV